MLQNARVKFKKVTVEKGTPNFLVEIAQFVQYGQEIMGLLGFMPSDLEHFGRSYCWRVL